MSEQIVIVMDCGATNVRSIAVNEKGELLAMHSFPNATRIQEGTNGLRCWDFEEIWTKLKNANKEVLKQIDKTKIKGVTTTAFGVDGAAMTKEGKMLYPVISWQCERTIPIMKNIDKYIALSDLYKISALQPMHFNAISKLIWLKENEPEILEKMDYYVIISSMFLHRLSGEFVTDTSQAGTSMLTDIKTREFSDKILNAISFDKSKFPPLVEPGDVVGNVTKAAAEETGLPEGIPVIAAGHDTQFAIYGSGAKENQPVLSSGTWEILMVRSNTYLATDETLVQGLTTEFDPVKGFYNMGVQWIASGALEWIKKMFYAKEAESKEIYNVMISEAKEAGPGSKGVRIHPCFTPGIGPSAQYNTHGSILGLTMSSDRGSVYRAMLEALACQLKEGVGILEKAAQFEADSLICVGGGSKNALWNQIRADILDLPVKLIEQKETTVLGAALFAMQGAGIYKSADEARDQINYKGEEFIPGENKKAYKNVYESFKTLAKDLSAVYKNQ